MTENGWQPSPRIEPGSPLLAWKTVPGTDVTLQVRTDPIGTVMLALAADYHAYIEPLRDPDSACYTPTNSVATSNHLNATAMDLNWNSHPFQRRGSFNATQLATIRELVGDGDDGGWYEGWIFWAGYWTDPIDEMHWQAGYNTYGRNAALADFIKRKIRPDGFSTFRRGTTAGGPLMALTAAEQRELLEKVRYVFDQHAPKHPAWGADSSLGTDAKGNELTLRDGLAAMKRRVDNPEVAIVTFHSQEP